MIVSELSTQVNDLLRPMGITRNLSAYSILCQCLELVCKTIHIGWTSSYPTH